MSSELKEFWDRELAANSVRKQPLDDIVYIELDLSKLPFDPSPADESIKDYQEKIASLEGKKIVNLTGISNTDLKLRYGVANLDYLSSCDDNYMELVKYLFLWANILFEQGRAEEAKQVLEYGVYSIHTDVRSHYKLLADMYADEFNFEAIDRITKEAEKIASPNRDSIVKMLKETDFFKERE